MSHLPAPAASPPRCLAVWWGVTAICAALVRLAAPVLPGRRLPGATVPSAPGRWLEEAAAAVTVGCAAWLWLLSGLVTLAALRGRDGDRLRGCPEGLRRLLLGCCGLALAGGGVVAPAQAAEPDGTLAPATDRRALERLTGLPLPQRAESRPVRAGAALLRTVPSVVVRPGDTLWTLAAASLAPDASDAAVVQRWHAIHRHNRAAIGADPDLILPGTVLRLPPPDAAASAGSSLPRPER